MIEYKLAHSFNYEELEAEVARMIRTGFKPHGSLVIHPMAGLYFQPMVKDLAQYEVKRMGPG